MAKSLPEAIVSGDLKRVEEAVESIPDLNVFLRYKSYTGLTPIAIACFEKQYKIAEYLLSKRADLFFIKTSGRILIQLACEKADQEIVRFVTTNMKHVNDPDENGDTPFARVVESNNLEAVQYLVQNMNANVCRKGVKSGESPLIKAMKNDNLEMVKYLVEHGALPSIRTALELALEKGQLEIAEYFIEQGANGLTPLNLALEGNYGKIVELLLKHQQIDLDLADLDGNTPLTKSVALNVKSITATLITAGANLNLVDERDGKTAFMKIVESGDFVLCKLATESGAKIDKLDRDGRNVLAIAAANGDLQIAIYLMKLSADQVIFNAMREIEKFAAYDKDFAHFLKRYNRQEYRTVAVKRH